MELKSQYSSICKKHPDWRSINAPRSSQLNNITKKVNVSVLHLYLS